MGLGPELITAGNDRDFRNSLIGNWVAFGGVSGTCTFSSANVGGSDDKQGLLTSSGDTELYAELPTTVMETLDPNSLFYASADVQVPTGNTIQDIILFWGNITEVPASYTFDLSSDLDSYVKIMGHFYLGADVIGSLRIGFDGNPADGDLMYFDNISVKQVFGGGQSLGLSLK